MIGFNPICPTVLPAICANQTPVMLSLSSISRIILLPHHADLPSSWLDLGSWEMVLSNSDVNKARTIFAVSGSMSKTPNLSAMPRGTQKRISDNYRIEATTNNEKYYDYLRHLQNARNKGFLRIWVETIGGYLFGGATGMVCLKYDVDFVYEESGDAIEYAKLTFDFDLVCAPDRALSPFVEVEEAEVIGDDFDDVIGDDFEDLISN